MLQLLVHTYLRAGGFLNAFRKSHCSIMFSENISLMNPIHSLKKLEHKLAAVCLQEKGRTSSRPVPEGSDGINPSTSRVVTRREILTKVPV
jgi:hypothetical protein